MPTAFSPEIVLIGAGNVGYHLGLRFKEQGLSIKQVFSRKKTKAKQLAQLTGASCISRLDHADPKGDIYILAVRDDAIEAVAQSLAGNINKNALVVHTSGATPGKLLQRYFSNFGVFYPLQSFSAKKNIDFSKIPICIDSSRKKNRQVLEKLAKCISPHVFYINDEQRRALHVAAVIVNNFTNQLYQIGQHILESKNISFDLLKPLIEETAAKVQLYPPKNVQTGPAIRGDLMTIKRHLDYLAVFPEYQEIYRLLSIGINPRLKLKI